MSAFMCSDDHLRILALAAEGGDLARARCALVELYQENCRSLQARYRDPFDPEDKGPSLTEQDAERIQRLRLSPVAILKLVQCYRYQSCEHDGWSSSKARDLCDHAMSQACTELPGYSDAAWGYW